MFYSITGGQRSIVMNSQFFKGYRQTILEPNEVLVSVLLPFSEENQYVAAYKQARRRDVDKAIVNACFSVKLRDDSVIEHCLLSFGGMNKTTVMATKTQSLLLNK